MYEYDKVVLEVDGKGQTKARNVYGINLLTRVMGSEKYNYLYNGHGDVTSLVESAGVVKASYRYDALGNHLESTGTVVNPIRYAGYQYDEESELYYLNARYYDPKIARFLSEDTYRGDSFDPLSLNYYTYTHNEPIMYSDPTGHWEQGDEKLNKEAQAKVIALTSAYYNAQTKGERDAISAQAKAIRADSKSYTTVVTPLVFQSAGISQVIDKAVNTRGYMTAAEWSVAIKSVGVQTTTSKDSQNLSGNKEEMTTTTTTTIGRTNIAVSSKDQVSLKNNGITISTASSSLQLSYNLNFNESKFVESMGGDGITLEQVLVLLDAMKSKNGDLTKSDLALAGLSYSAGLFGTSYGDNLSVIETLYNFSQKGINLTEAQLMYQEEVINKNIEAAFGIAGIRMATGGFRFNSKRSTPSATASYTGCNCFTAGTKVQTDEGEKPIEEIEVGDKVLAKSEYDSNGELAYKEVTALYRNQRDDIIKLHVGKQIIETTDNHPFWVEGKGWVFADELQVGDKLQKFDGSNLTIDKVEFVKLDEPVTVYNFTVADFHTYYVTDLGIWVHNTNCNGVGLTGGNWK